MAQTLAELEAQLAALQARRHTTAGIKSSSFGDQRTDFDGDDLDKQIASVTGQIRALTSGSSTRYAAVSKDC